MTTMIIIGVIAVIAIIAIWKWRKAPEPQAIKNIETPVESVVQNTPDPPQSSQDNSPPPMVFAVNLDGELDLTDMSGRALNIAFGHNQKVYINLLDFAEKDIVKEDGKMTSKVGTTKLYEVGGRPYIINYTRLGTF